PARVHLRAPLHGRVLAGPAADGPPLDDLGHRVGQGRLRRPLWPVDARRTSLHVQRPLRPRAPARSPRALRGVGLLHPAHRVPPPREAGSEAPPPAAPPPLHRRRRGEWYLTGDRPRRDEDGYLWFVGRADDVIISAGYRIGPFEVESALLEHPAVVESAVVASPDPVRGEIVKAFVVLRPGHAPG